MEKELQLHYIPSEWVINILPEKAVQQHISNSTLATCVAQKKVPHQLNVEYGTKTNQMIDLYGIDLPKESPIFVYIHGGYWQARSKDISAYPVIPLWNAGIRSAIHI